MQKPVAVKDRLIRELDYTTEEMLAFHELAEDEPDEDPWTRNMIMSCEWDCDYSELCLIELMGGDGKLIRRSKYQPSGYIGGRKLGAK